MPLIDLLIMRLHAIQVRHLPASWGSVGSGMGPAH
jgi:hypothetical protein